MYAGKIPGSFFRREGRPSETAILTARLIDRPLRPHVPRGLPRRGPGDHHGPVGRPRQPVRRPAMNAASLAVGIAGLPFDGPVGAVRLGLIGGEWVVNPTFQEADEATFDIVVAGSKNAEGGIDILMIEGEAPETSWPLLAAGEGAAAPTEEVVAQGLERAKEVIAEVIELQEEFLAQVGVKPSDFEPRPCTSRTSGTRSSRSRRTRSRPRSCPTRRSARPTCRAQGGGQGPPRVDARRGRVRDARPGVLGRVEVPREEGDAGARDRGGRPPRRARAKDIRPLAAHVSLLPGRTAPRCSSAATRRS